MLELTRGYAAAVLDGAVEDGVLDEVVTGLEGVTSLLISSEPLRRSLLDGSVPAEARGAFMSDLLEPRVRREVVALCTLAIVYERAVEIAKTYEGLRELAEARQGAGSALVAEPAIGRSGAFERLRGFAERVFEELSHQEEIDSMEDELFRLARIVESERQLRSALAGIGVPLEGRVALLESLIGGKVRPETLALSVYVLRCGRERDFVGALDYLVSLAARERGRRVADVRSAVELDTDARRRLAEALGQRTRRTVELRVTIDPSLLGGLDVVVGDTVIDGTVRHRLEELRDEFLQAS